MKRLMDITLALAGLLVAGPFLLGLMVLIWLEDRHSPLYRALRMGRGGLEFEMLKLRSMAVDADKSGVFSTAKGDRRITRVGALVRRFKMDELMQLWNVLKGDMSLVGPRPQVMSEVAHYTAEEKGLLKVLPGGTDLASIVFADEGDILLGHDDPDLAYNQLIRPWKSRLGLLYIERQSLGLDVRLILLTALALVCRRYALSRISGLVASFGGDAELVSVAGREEVLTAHPPPGSDAIITAGCGTAL